MHVSNVWRCSMRQMVVATVILFLIGLAMPSHGLSIGRTPIAADAWYELEGAAFSELAGVVQDGGVTAKSVIILDRSYTQEVESVVLVGLGSAPGQGADALRVVWEPDSSSWGFIWSLQLQSDTGLLPGGARSMELGKVLPVAGHEYETTLSFDAAAGHLSMSLVDITDNKTLFKGGRVLNAGAIDTVSSGAKVKTKDRRSEIVNVIGLDALGGFVPVGTEWSAAIPTETGAFIPSQRFDLDEEIVVRVNPGSSVPGQFRLVFDSPLYVGELARITEVADRNEIRFAADSLPLGPGVLRLDYIDGGHVLLSEQRSVTIGHSRFTVSSINIDRENWQINGVMRGVTAKQIDDIRVQFDVLINEEVWNANKRDFDVQLHAVHGIVNDVVTLKPDGSYEVPFTVPMPEEKGLYRLDYRTATDRGIGVETHGSKKLFTTYAAASPEPGETWAIAVLPDTQNYARSYPVMYNRQLQYIAEIAERKNILLVLHVGDITNDNVPLQWDRSVEAITLLDGVVPYMLAQGNHDMPATGGGGAHDRTSTLMNKYFPVESMPWVEGTFPPGRIENNYATFDLMGEDYLVISLEFGPRNEALDWANEVVAAHPDHKVIYISHAHTARGGGLSNHATSYPIASNPDTTVNGGGAVWSDWLTHHENIFMTLSGHHDAQNAISRSISRGRNGNIVFNFMTNYQFDGQGGSGTFPLFEFHPDGTIEVHAYSPYLDEWRTDISDYGFNNHFLIDVNRGRYVTLGVPEQSGW